MIYPFVLNLNVVVVVVVVERRERHNGNGIEIDKSFVRSYVSSIVVVVVACWRNVLHTIGMRSGGMEEINRTVLEI